MPPKKSNNNNNTKKAKKASPTKTQKNSQQQQQQKESSTTTTKRPKEKKQTKNDDNVEPESAASVYQRLVVKKLQNQHNNNNNNLPFITSANIFEHVKSFNDITSGAILKTPAQVQLLIDNLIYHAKPTSCPRIAFETKHAHCLEGALLAAAALKPLGYKPKIVFLGAANDDGHALCIYQNKDGSGCYGSIGQSNFAGLRSRCPVYESVRELVMSFFDVYFSIFGERTLRFYSDPLDLEEFDSLNWETNQDAIKKIEKALYQQERINLMKSLQMQKNLDLVDERSFIAGLTGIRLEAVYGVK